MNPETQDNPSNPMISAVVLAAGASRRMGQPKMLLPWGSSTVIVRVVDTLIESGVQFPVIVTGRSAQEVKDRLSSKLVCWAHNPDYENSEMLKSLQIGMPMLPEQAVAFLVVLGDQPQIESVTVKQLIWEYLDRKSALIIPSYQFRRGHPWLVRRDLWPELLSLPAHANLRVFLNAHASDIEYLNVESPSVLMDLDTPEDYIRQKPGA